VISIVKRLAQNPNQAAAWPCCLPYST